MSELARAILGEMRDNASNAIEHTEQGGDRWEENELVVDAVANRVRQVTEAAKYRFPDDEKAAYSQIPWDDLARARDFYTHHYDRLDVNRLRSTVENELRDLVAVLNGLDLPHFDDT